ncbi:MAG: four helix bundle protein [Bythopirellula sp.]|nr:four helix bundle protein [Bythopirellula sp.]
MAGYQDLKVWQVGIQITRSVYQITATFPDSEKFGLTSQLRRCAVSIPSNIAEGHSRESKRELARFVSIARGSLAELETQLLIAKELGFGNKAQIDQLIETLKEEGRMLSGLRRSLIPKSEN